MLKGNETQKKKFAALLEWLEELKFTGTADVQCQVMNMLEAWLSTDYANKPSDRNAYYYNSQLITKGMSLIEQFSPEDFETLKQLMQAEHVS